MPYVKIYGFAPDADPTTDGVLLDVTDLVPTARGMEARPGAVPTPLPALDSQVMGAGTVRLLDGTVRTFAGISAFLFESTATSWNNVSRSTSLTYTATTVTPWRFAQFNDYTFAANASDNLQVNQGAGLNFGDVSGHIKATIVETVGDFVLLFNTTDAEFGISPNRWWCSGIGNGTTFAPSLATQAATGTLAATPGAITAGHQLGSDQVVAYKASSIYLGRYVGPPAIWAWSLITEEIGAPCQEAVVTANDGQFFFGNQNVYFYDGTRPVPIGNELKEWIYANLDHNKAHRIRSFHEQQQSRVWWFLPLQGGDGSLTTFLVYNYRTGKWGKGDLSVEVLMEFISPGLSYDDFGSAYSTWDDIPAVPFDFPPWLDNTSYFAFFDASHTLQSLTGESSGGSLLTGWMGFDGKYTFGHRVRPRYKMAPDSANLVHRWQRTLGSNINSADVAISLIDGKFDFERSERWHGLRIDGAGAFEILGIDIEALPDGFE